MFLYEKGRDRSLTTPSMPCLRTYNRGTYKRRKRSVSATYVRTYRMIEGGIEYSGYIDIKQPAKIKGRKLKSWKKKWVVVHEMSIRSAGRSAAKVDIYADEKTAEKSPADKLTFILEFVTDIRPAKSKTHSNAFEIVEREPVLLLSGATELDTQTWVSTFRKIFFPDQEESDIFPVFIISNKHATRLSLVGDYKMTVNPEVIAIISEKQNSYEWSLNMLKRFHLEKDAENAAVEILTIECGPKSECGEATFQFRSDHVSNILASIKANIYLALNRQKADRWSKSSTSSEKVWRSSVTSNASSSSGIRARSGTNNSMEQRYKDLLETTSNSSHKELSSKNSENSIDSGSVNSDDISPAKDILRRKRPSVTFDTAVINECTSTEDLLSSTIEITDDENASEYNKVEFHLPKTSTGVKNIITTFTVAKPGYETKVLLDEHGYSHVDIVNSKPAFTVDKARSLSNMSSHSSVSGRSASVGSKDSGIIYTVVDKSVQFERGVSSHRSTNSFDSAVSTSSTVEGKETSPIDSNATTLTVDIQEVQVTAAEFMSVLGNTEREITVTNDNGIYQDVSLDENKCDIKSVAESDNSCDKLKLRKCNSTGDFRAEEKENEYEDLDNFRKGKKNLVKHLGMDPKVDPKSVPPSLPERPTSYKVKRKFQNGEKKLFTLPFARNKGKKQKERTVSISSSSSESDSESTKGSKKNGQIAVKVWPLGNKSVIAGNEDLYQPIAIERFLKDNEAMPVPQKRERSSSLNLNMSTAMKRPTIEAIDRKKSMWRHNRNVSMQMDMLNRTNGPMSTDFKQNFDLSLQPEMLGRDRNLSDLEMTAENERTSDSFDMGSDDEPIYAEVEPATCSEVMENPFPDLTEWKPADISDVAELNETHYENDESMESVNDAVKIDMLNQGFVIDDETNVRENCDNENVLIDLSVTEPGDSGNTTNTAVDIFNMGVGPSLLETSLMPIQSGSTSTTEHSRTFVDIFHLGCGTPLPPSSSDLLNKSYLPVNPVPQNNVSTTSRDNGQAQESIYMDMSSYKNESIYVMPSSLKQ